jgi:Zn-dependent M28 family amino/carboxypeptidase
MNHRGDEEFRDFVEYNDLGLPLAYAVAENVISVSDKARLFIEETFDVFLAGLEIEDTGFETLDELLAQSEAAKSN